MAPRFTLVEMASAQQEVKKSRFRAVAGPVADEAAAKTFVASQSDPAANHNCWAWRLGQSYRFSDDGEPSGTAGKPMLAAIDGQALDHVAIVVTRWFGGILLGSGGLVRAYGGTASLCLREAPKVEIVETASGTVSCTFGDFSLLEARLSAVAGVRVDVTFTSNGASLAIASPKAQMTTVDRLVADLTSGRSSIRWDA